MFSTFDKQIIIRVSKEGSDTYGEPMVTVLDKEEGTSILLPLNFTLFVLKKIEEQYYSSPCESSTPNE